MSFNRRDFLGLMAGLGASALVNPASAIPAARQIKAIAFDAFPVFDPRPVFALCEQLFPGQGMALSEAWRTRQFEYQWLRTLAGRYVDFWQATEDALVYAASRLKLELTQARRTRLMQTYLQLKAWPDAAPALTRLKQTGYQLAFLSNATPAILHAGITNANLGGVFDHVLSTDAIRSYKPDPRAYALGTDVLALPKDQILFVAFAGWDVAGAKWFGYPTYWVNRLQLPAETLGVHADGEGRTLADLVQFLGA